MKNTRKTLVTVFKIGISLVLLYFVFRKVPFSEVWELVKKGNPVFLFLALVAFVASQWISSCRLQKYFEAQHFYLKTKSNWKLYLVGMFYNFFIPGGIGGDAYKVYLLNKRFGWSAKKLTASVFCDRVSGLLAIVILIQLLAIPVLNGWYRLLVIPSVLVTVFISKLIYKRFFSSFHSVFFETLLYSFGVQLLQLVCIYFILHSFTNVENVWIYFMVFLLSAVLSIVSFSGIGVREWLFLKAAQYFDFSSGISVSTALLFSFITALVSLLGVWYQIKGISPEKDYH